MPQQLVMTKTLLSMLKIYHFYRPQTKLHQFVILFTGAACMVAPGGCAWLLPGGGVRGSSGGVCMVAPGGHAWLLWGGVRGFIQECVWFYLGGMCGFIQGGMHGFIQGGMHGFIQGAYVVLFGGCAWFFQFFRIQ